jgi:hypothetical protein
VSAREEALQHLLWAVSQGQTPEAICRSLGFDLPKATAEVALSCLETVALEMRASPALRIVK